jgi:hypothetical protein
MVKDKTLSSVLLIICYIAGFSGFTADEIAFHSRACGNIKMLIFMGITGVILINHKYAVIEAVHIDAIEHDYLCAKG